MSMNNISGSVLVNAANGNGVKAIIVPPYPVVGTVTIHVVNTSSFSGTIKAGLIGLVAPDNTTPVDCIYQRSDTSGDIAAGTALVLDKVNYFRVDGAKLVITVSGYVSGSCTIYWQWSQG